MHLIYKLTGLPVKVGEVAKTFRDEKVIVTGWREPHHAGSTGRVYVQSIDERKMHCEFYPSVCGMKWVD